jgi:Co/Zn/Cd efflux system component
MGMGIDPTADDRSGRKKRLLIVFFLTLPYLIAEVVGGLWTRSLALLADAGHMLTDVGGLAIALFAMWFAERPPTPRKSSGYYRIEILAAVEGVEEVHDLHVWTLTSGRDALSAHVTLSRLENWHAIQKSLKRFWPIGF